MNTFKALSKQEFSMQPFSLVPIRMEDRYSIMEWRNEQMYHLRQNNLLSKEDQDQYFNTVVKKLFDQEKPDQNLFSYLNDGNVIGYGGLVHINWIDKHAEISFIMNTALEEQFFESHWTNYLGLLEQVAFEELNFHKIFVYAFDLRPRIYSVLKKNNYFKDATLKDHCFYETRFIDVVIYSKIQPV